MTKKFQKKKNRSPAFLIMNNDLKFACTGIGALPHNNVIEAIMLIQENFPTLPYLPQLTNVNKFENITYQCLENLVCLRKEKNRVYMVKNLEDIEIHDYNVDNYEINYFSAMRLFLNLLDKYKPQYAKAEIIGPFTLSMILKDNKGERVFFDEDLRNVIINHIALKGLWLAKKIKEKGIKPVIFFDEPSIAMVGPYSNIKREDVLYMLSKIVNRLKMEQITVGIHCSNKCDWSIVTDSMADILSFDAFSYAAAFSQYHKKIDRYLNNGGMIAWGIIPALSENIIRNMTLDSAYLGFYMAINNLIEKGVDKNKLLSSAIITPSCTMADLSVELAQKVVNLTKELSLKLKET